jgi:hypothetical protein
VRSICSLRASDRLSMSSLFLAICSLRKSHSGIQTVSMMIAMTSALARTIRAPNVSATTRSTR